MSRWKFSSSGKGTRWRCRNLCLYSDTCPLAKYYISIKFYFLYFLDEFCEEFPHNLIPTPGYWIECSRQKINTDTIWDESESDRDVPEEEDEEEETDSGIPLEKQKNDGKDDQGENNSQCMI